MKLTTPRRLHHPSGSTVVVTGAACWGKASSAGGRNAGECERLSGRECTLRMQGADPVGGGHWRRVGGDSDTNTWKRKTDVLPKRLIVGTSQLPNLLVHCLMHITLRSPLQRAAADSCFYSICPGLPTSLVITRLRLCHSAAALPVWHPTPLCVGCWSARLSLTSSCFASTKKGSTMIYHHSEPPEAQAALLTSMMR
jgi:hypothetical protein